MDVLADPSKGQFLIKEAQIAFIQRDSVRFRAKRESKDIRAVIDRDKYYVLIFRQTCLFNQFS